MNSIPPPPPDMFIHHGKYDGFERPSGHLRQKGHVKRKRMPIDEHDWYLGVFINDEGDYEICSSSNLAHVAEQLLKIAAEGMLQEHQEYQVRRPQQNPPRHSPTKTFKLRTTGNDKVRARLDSVSTSNISRASVPRPLQDDRRSSYGNDGDQTMNNSVNSNSIAVPMYHNALSAPKSQRKSMSHTTGRETMVTRRMLEIRMCETDKWNMWFGDAFRAIQQQACRFIAKEWIKLIHPKKQSTHPYNGNFPRNFRASSEFTRPPYWPGDVIHKEPDHIDKDSRTKLLVWLLTHTPQREITTKTHEGDVGGKEIVASDMLDVLTKKKDELNNKWEIICAIIEVRTKLENFEEGGCDPDDIMNVPDYQEMVGPCSNVKKPRPRTRVKPKQEPEDSGGESPARTLTAPGSPTGSSITQVDYDDDDGENNEDGKSAMNISFSSSGTRKSSKSSKSSARMVSMNLNHSFPSNLQASSNQSLGPVILDSRLPTGIVNMNTPVHIEPRQSAPHQSWHTPRAMDEPMHVTFPEGTPTQAVMPMLDHVQFDHFLDSTHTGDSSALMVPMAYYDSQQFGSGFEQQLNRNAAFRPIPGMAHAVNLGPDFALHESYCRMYGPGGQPP